MVASSPVTTANAEPILPASRYSSYYFWARGNIPRSFGTAGPLALKQNRHLVTAHHILETLRMRLISGREANSQTLLNKMAYY